MKPLIDNMVFHIDGVWRCIVNNKIYGDWRSKEEATAVMKTEQKRSADHARNHEP